MVSSFAIRATPGVIGALTRSRIFCFRSNAGRRAFTAALKATRLLNWSFYSNFYDIVYVIARKRR